MLYNWAFDSRPLMFTMKIRWVIRVSKQGGYKVRWISSIQQKLNIKILLKSLFQSSRIIQTLDVDNERTIHESCHYQVISLEYSESFCPMLFNSHWKQSLDSVFRDFWQNRIFFRFSFLIQIIRRYIGSQIQSESVQSRNRWTKIEKYQFKLWFSYFDFIMFMLSFIYLENSAWMQDHLIFLHFLIRW